MVERIRELAVPPAWTDVGGLTIGGVIETFGEAPGSGDPQAVVEQAVLDLICGHESSDAVEAADQLVTALAA